MSSRGFFYNPKQLYQDKKRYLQARKNLTDCYAWVFNDNFKSKANPNDYFTEWNEHGWMGGSLAQLNTGHPDVMAAQKRLLAKLEEIGVDGFRFDAVGHMSPQSLREYKKFISSSRFVYGEYVDENHVGRNQEYTSIMGHITDFILQHSLRKAFSLNGSLRDLRVPATNHDPKAVTFADNHDTRESKRSKGRVGINFVFGDEKDMELATCYILARY